MNSYIVATTKAWNITAFEHHRGSLPGNWFLARNPDELNMHLRSVNPKYIFFPHWSWKVPSNIAEENECVCFHMTDVPYGRGGSPLQNLIIRGHAETKLSALKMTDEIDAGPVYCKRNLSLQGSAQKIFTDMAEKVYEIINYIIEKQPEPSKQVGEVVTFSRRVPSQSELPKSESLTALYDHIRMLDADSYPRAFVTHGEYKIEFSGAQIMGDSLVCTVSIEKGVEP